MSSNDENCIPAEIAAYIRDRKPLQAVAQLVDAIFSQQFPQLIAKIYV